MRDAILKMIEARPGASFAELCRDLPGFDGEFVVPSRFENVILWNGVSGEALTALVSLDREGKVKYKVTPVLTYLIDGAMLKVPVAKMPKAYKSLRWLPVTLHLTKKSR